MALKIKRQLNFTDRLPLFAKDVSILTAGTANGEVLVRVLKIDLPDQANRHDQEDWRSAKVILEASRLATSSFERFEIGRVHEVVQRPVPKFVQKLSKLSGIEAILFSVKVVSARTGRLLAVAMDLTADNLAIPPAADELIQVIPKDIGEEPWRLEWDPGNGEPRVLVNSRIRDAAGFLLRDVFIEGAVMPQILRSVLLRVALEPDLREEGWAKRWLKFAAGFAPTYPPQADDDIVEWNDAHNWADATVASFCSRFSMTARINMAAEKADEEAAA